MIKKKPRIRLTETERDAMREAGRFNARLMDLVREHVFVGQTTEAIDRLVHTFTLDHGHIPACLGYQGDFGPFPKSCCTSVNDVICHGIPGQYTLKDGDIINIDLTTIVDGWHADQSETFLVGQCRQNALKVTQCSFDCLYRAIDALTPGCRVAEIGEAVVRYARDEVGYGVVDKYVGHGIGLLFHQRPNIPHVPTRTSYREYLEPGMCFTIEPMINEGSASSKLDHADGWTVRTTDGKLSAQFEHTILMTEDGPEILTKTLHGPQRGHRFC
ncbi:MAG TPA: type I methionyl aminopeptidase [Pirellulaceae bacterium]|nr:type I methionyl aminopeptidase [Pirellulaceae bacterium]HMO90793.1 type I methionyl aminopeptidase [Pirellulaceae bacterium]HMP68044.1 type I methionyl aminopeptidase [Pirellulaceae bacterium]